MKNESTSRLSVRREEEGFTLIELLIVIVILGILAAIVVFAVGSTRKDAVSGSCKTDATSIQLAAEAGKTKNGTYPTAAVIITDAGGGLLKSATIAQTDYTLTYSGTGTDYSIAASAGTGGTQRITGTPALSSASDAAAVKTFCAGT